MATETEKKSKRGSMATKGYLLADGTTANSAKPEAEGIVFTFGPGGGEPVIVPLADIPDAMKSCAVLHGLSQKLGDSYAGAEDAADARESFDTMLERILAGEWVAERKASGPSTGVLVEAITRVLTDAGRPVNLDSIREKVKGKEGREKALANPVIAAAYEKIKAERAALRAEKAAAKAEGASIDDF